ncbi:MAG: MFS transporter [Alistipes sp.]|nr:MFS transporter [Alistipes sp.]
MKIETGKGQISLIVLVAIWSVSAVVSLPGLAISPILGDLNKIFPKASDLEIQMLTSLPSLLIIPFVLIAGHLSVGKDKLKILFAGLAIFFLSGAACLLAKSMVGLIVISCVLGIGAGMVVPLSTGLVVDYFTGERRVTQLGISSAINNLTLVLATAITGYLATRNWHLPFLVYLLPGISLLLVPFLHRQKSAPEPKESDQLRNTQINIRRLIELMVLYFLITFAVLVVSYYAGFLIEEYKMHSSFSGILISLFFLAIVVPGFFLNSIIGFLKGWSNIVSLAMMAVGLLLFGLGKSPAAMVIGSLMSGFGYGIMQPIIYDKAAIIAPPHLATLALSYVMAVNYLAVVVCPFILDGFRKLFHTKSELFPFMFCGVLLAIMFIVAIFGRRDWTLGLDTSYYQKPDTSTATREGNA